MADVIDAIIAEALGEGPEGMAAVAHVINTRALQSGKTPEQIVNERAQFSGVSNPGRSVAQSMRDPKVRAQVAEIWNGVTSGRIANPFPNADFFHTPQVSPDWASQYTRAGQLGNHIFYASGTPSGGNGGLTPVARTPSAPIPPRNVGRSTDWLSYDYGTDTIRNRPISEQLTSALSFLPELGVSMRVFSGGETPERKASNSGRHLHGNAADVYFYKGGRRLDWADPNDLPIFQEIVRRGRENGLTGFGAGDGYMRPGSMHLGFGDAAAWGAGGKSANAPKWLLDAFNGAGVGVGSKLDVVPSGQRTRPQAEGDYLLGQILANLRPTAASRSWLPPTPATMSRQTEVLRGQNAQLSDRLQQADLEDFRDVGSMPTFERFAQLLGPVQRAPTPAPLSQRPRPQSFAGQDGMVPRTAPRPASLTQRPRQQSYAKQESWVPARTAPVPQQRPQIAVSATGYVYGRGSDGISRQLGTIRPQGMSAQQAYDQANAAAEQRAASRGIYGDGAGSGGRGSYFDRVKRGENASGGGGGGDRSLFG